MVVLVRVRARAPALTVTAAAAAAPGRLRRPLNCYGAALMFPLQWQQQEEDEAGSY